MDPSEAVQAILSGVVQGVTELLPVSSSGHLLLYSRLTGTDLTIAAISVLHLGTLVAILVSLRDRLGQIVNTTVLRNVVISTIPAGVVGFFLEEFIESEFANPSFIVVMLITWGLVFIAVDRFRSQIKPSSSKLSSVTIQQAVVIGIAQVLAFFPGTSRSGVTIVAGIVSGLKPDIALAYSFIIGIPILALAGIIGIPDVVGDTGISLSAVLVSTLVAAATGLATAAVLKKYILRNILTICGIYRLVLGVTVLLLLA